MCSTIKHTKTFLTKDIEARINQQIVNREPIYGPRFTQPKHSVNGYCMSSKNQTLPASWPLTSPLSLSLAK